MFPFFNAPSKKEIVPFLSYWIVQVDKAQFEKVLSFIDHGIREGASLLTGGKPLGLKGYYIEPTIFTDVKVSTLITSL